MTFLLKSLAHLCLLYCLGCTNEPAINSEKDILKNQSATPNVFQGKIMKSANQGKSWENISEGIPDDFTLLFVDFAEGHGYIGSNSSSMYVKKMDETSQWLKADIPLSAGTMPKEGEYAVTGIFSTLSGIYANVFYDGLYKKQKGSSEWKYIQLPKGLNFIHDVAESEKGALYVAGPDGVYLSDNQGLSWDLIFNLGWVRNILLSGNTIMVSGQHGIYNSDDQGGHWSKLSLKPSFSFYDLSSENQNFSLQPFGNELLAIRQASASLRGISGKLQFSKDAGKTWEIHPADTYIKNLEGVRSVLSDGDKLYCSYNEGLICSEDNGITWNFVLKSDVNDKNVTFSLYICDGIIYCLKTLEGC